MSVWEPDDDTRIYEDPSGARWDPLRLRRAFIDQTMGAVWRIQKQRREAAQAMAAPDADPDSGAWAATEVTLAEAERTIVEITRKVMDLAEPQSDPAVGIVGTDGFTDAEVLQHFDHFLRWLNQKKTTGGGSRTTPPPTATARREP